MAGNKELKPLVLVFKSEPELYAITGDTRQKLNLERAEKLNLKEEFLCITQGQSAGKGQHTGTLCSITTDYDTRNGEDSITVTDTVVDDSTDGN